jgi:hypothetical protein
MNQSQLTQEQIIIILNDGQFDKKAKRIARRLNISDKDARQELINRCAFTFRAKNFISIKDELNGLEHAYIEFCAKDVEQEYFENKKKKNSKESSLEKLQNLHLYGNYRDFDVTYEDSDQQFEEHGDFSAREKKAIFDSLDVLLTKPSAKFVRYLMQYGEDATKEEFNLDTKHLNSKVKSLCQTIRAEKVRAKVELLGIKTDKDFQWEDDIEQLNELAEMENVEELKEYVLSHEGEEGFVLFDELNYKEMLEAFDSIKGEGDKKLGYKLVNALMDQINYMKGYVYY